MLSEETIGPGLTGRLIDDAAILGALRRRAKQTLLLADRCKDEFLATLVHRLRDPLAPVKNGSVISFCFRLPASVRCIACKPFSDFAGSSWASFSAYLAWCRRMPMKPIIPRPASIMS